MVGASWTADNRLHQVSSISRGIWISHSDSRMKTWREALTPTWAEAEIACPGSESGYAQRFQCGNIVKRRIWTRMGFDGLIYPSYFSLVRTGATPFDTAYGISVRRFPSYTAHAKSQIIPNIALFGRPIEGGTVKVDCINRLVLNRVVYDLQFGPVEV